MAVIFHPNLSKETELRWWLRSYQADRRIGFILRGYARTETERRNQWARIIQRGRQIRATIAELRGLM